MRRKKKLNKLQEKVNICQHGIDGFGHQLHGLFSLLILHNIKNYYFDGIYYLNKSKKFDHISKDYFNQAINYLNEVVSKFIFDHSQIKINYKSKLHSHEIYKIPKNYNSEIIYTLDNAYYFDRLNLNLEEKLLHNNNIEKFKQYFINDKLPSSRLKEKNIVIHIRLGDALLYSEWRKKIKNHNRKIKILMGIFKKKFPDHTVYIHSNGEPDFLKGYEYVFLDKNTPVLQMLSDFIYSNIFVCGESSFSKVCTFLGNHEIVIVPDDTTQSIDENSIYISKYIEMKNPH